MEQRKHPRAQLELPVRIRWQGPLGMRVEVTGTVDVARQGLLVRRLTACEAPARVWVAFPYDATLGGPHQPETPARIVRVQPELDGTYRVALQLEPPHRESPRQVEQERRASRRIRFALPIFVRAVGTPFPEESMTRDISQNGARFETSHIYAVGDAVLAIISWNEWSKAGELAGRVVRVESMEDPPGPAPVADPKNGTSAIFTTVAVEWTSQITAAFFKGREVLRTGKRDAPSGGHA
jgi:PilZ domain